MSRSRWAVLAAAVLVAMPVPAAHALRPRAAQESGLEEEVAGALGRATLASAPRTHLTRALRKLHTHHAVAMTIIPNPLAVVVAEFDNDAEHVPDLWAAWRERVWLLDIRTGRRRVIARGDLHGPRAMAHDSATGLTYIAQWRTRQVVGVDLRDRRPLTTSRVTVPLSDYPSGLAVKPGQMLYVAESSAGRVRGFDLRSSRWTFRIHDSLSSPEDMVLDHERDILYVADRLRSVIQAYDATTGLLLRTSEHAPTFELTHDDFDNPANPQRINPQGSGNPVRLALDARHHILFVVGQQKFLGGFYTRDVGATKAKAPLPLTFSNYNKQYQRNLWNAQDIAYDPVDGAILVAGPDSLVPFWITSQGLATHPSSAPTVPSAAGAEESERDSDLAALRKLLSGKTFNGSNAATWRGQRSLTTAVEVTEDGTIQLTVNGDGRDVSALEGTKIAMMR
ncbi:MAG: hypothetical protein HY600_07405, partial [Candidatus Omnitrophica bacterium]|nr:hypothetical protein [Candidatus Omnitrophota bacterium]